MSLLTREFSTRLLVFFTFNIPLLFWILEGTDIVSSSFQYFLLLWFWYFSPAILTWFSSVQFSCSVMSDSLWPHEPQHARPSCLSPTPGVYPNPFPFSRWCPPTISSSVVPFSSCPQSFPASGSFQMSQLSAWGGQSIGGSASNISPSSEHPGLISFRMDWLDLLAVQGTLKSLLQHHWSKVSILRCSAFVNSPTVTSIHDYWKNHSFHETDLC